MKNNRKINYDEMQVADQIEFDRFVIRKDEPFTILRAVEFDIEVSAPVQMRVLELNFDVDYYENIYKSEWIYKVEILQDLDEQNREGLIT